jgi:DNA-binding LacI/PurR family transcriptional regulator
LVPINNADEQLIADISIFWFKQAGPDQQVRRVSGDLRRYRRPGKLLKQWIQQNAATHLLFENPSSAWVQAIQRIGIPCYYLGGELNMKDIQAKRRPGSSIMLNWVFKDVLERLRKMGHQRLLIPFDHTRVGNRESLKETLYEVCDGDLTKKECDRATPVFKEFDPDAWQRDWELFFQQCNPSIIIVTNQLLLTSIYAFCARKKIELGKDLALLSIHDEFLYDWLYPRPTRLRYPYNESLQDFKSWVRSGFLDRKHKFLEMEWVQGDTL